jgi:outer membrane protein assembly factor BamB
MRILPIAPGLLALAGALATAAPAAGSDDTWPQWRGPTRDGQVRGSTWPDRVTGRMKRVWHVAGLGPSYSGPIVGDSMVFTTETRDEEVEIVRAFHRDTGEVAWETTWSGSMKVPFFAARNGSWIRSTPALDGAHLIVGGMRDVLVCLRAADGSEVWRVDFVERYGSSLPRFGFVSSPLIVGDHVYVQAGASFCKLDKATGGTVWRTLVDDGGMDSVFSSPVMATVGGRTQLLVLTRTHMHGLDPEGGDVLWQTPIKAFRGMNILTPIVADDGVFTATYGGRAQLIDISTDGGGYAPSPRWSHGAQGYMTSPVDIDGHVYYFTRSNRFVCLRLADGEPAWTSPPTGDDYWSLAANGDHILALSDAGRIRLIRATPEAYEVVDEISVAEAPTWAHLAVAGRHVVIREQDGLSVWAWE